MSWSIEYSVRPSFEEGFSIVINSLRQQAHSSWHVRVQRGSWLEIEPWNELKHATVFEFEISESEAALLFNNLSQAAVSAAAPPVWGLDGTTHFLSISSGFHSSSFQWWSELPKGWKNLEGAIAQLESYADRFCSNA